MGDGRRRRGAPPARANRADERYGDEHDREKDQYGGEAAIEEIERAPVTRDQRLPKLPLRRVPKDERDHERRERVLHLPQPVTDKPEDHGDEYVEHAVVERVRADDRDHDDERRDDRVRHPHDHREERHREQAEDEGQEMPEVDAGDEAPDEVGVLDEKDRPWLEAPYEEPGHDDGGRWRSRNPERDHRHERSDAGGVGRGLRTHDPGYLAFAEVLLVLRVLAREAVAEERSGGGAVAR